MEQLIIKILKKLLPGLIEGLHQPSWGIVTRIPNPPNGSLSADSEPYYAVDVQLLDHTLKPTGPIYEAVPLPSTASSNARGFFGLPQKGARVIVDFAYGSPQHPFISNVYPLDKFLPILAEKDMLIQQGEGMYARATPNNWDIRAKSKVRVGNASVDLVKEVRAALTILKTHTHPQVGVVSQASALAGIESKVKQIEI